MGNINKAFIANTEADQMIKTFGRDRSPNTTTLQITENGEYDVRAYVKAIVNVEQGSTNTREILTGKANQLQLSAETIAALQTASTTGDIDAFIMIDTSPLQMGIDSIAGPLWYTPQGLSLMYFEAGEDVASCNAYEVLWDTVDGAISSAAALMGGSLVALTPYMSLLDCYLWINHHPMSEA